MKIYLDGLSNRDYRSCTDSTKGSTNPEMANRKTVPAHTFIKQWQRGKTLSDVAEKLNMSPDSAKVRAMKYRQHGVPLKKFAKGGRSEATWQQLAKLAKAVAK